MSAAVVSTENCQDGEDGGYWQDLSKDLALTEVRPVGGTIHGWARVKSIASLKVFDGWWSSPCVVSSASSATRWHRPEYGVAVLVLDGTKAINQDGRNVVLRPGDLAVHDLTRPFTATITVNVRVVGVMFPLRMISIPRTILHDLAARRMNACSVSAAQLASFLTVLCSRLDSILPEEEVGISSAVGGLVTATLAPLVGGRATMEAKCRRSVLVTAIRRFVEAEIADPGLNPARVAAAHHISLRQLHRMFEHEDMTVAELIRTIRLEYCKRDLADPVLRDQSISAIATRWGIPDSARFSHVFRAAYGVSPRDYRRGTR